MQLSSLIRSLKGNTSPSILWRDTLSTVGIPPVLWGITSAFFGNTAWEGNEKHCGVKTKSASGFPQLYWTSSTVLHGISHPTEHPPMYWLCPLHTVLNILQCAEWHPSTVLIISPTVLHRCCPRWKCCCFILIEQIWFPYRHLYCCTVSRIPATFLLSVRSLSTISDHLWTIIFVLILSIKSPLWLKSKSNCIVSYSLL